METEAVEKGQLYVRIERLFIAELSTIKNTTEIK